MSTRALVALAAACFLLEADLVALARRFDRLGTGPVAIPSTYTEADALRR